MADNFDEQYMTTRRDTRIWQQAQIERLSTGTEGAGTLEDPETELAVTAPTNEGTTLTELKLAKPPTVDTVPEEVKPEPIAGRKEFTVDTPEVQELRTQAREQLKKISTGEIVAEEAGKAGKQLGEALAPGFRTAALALGMDENAADATATAFVEIMAGLPGKSEEDLSAGLETGLALLPGVGMAVKAGKAGKKLAKGAKAADAVSTPVTWEEAVKIDESTRAFEDRLKTFSERLSTQRRGVRSDVQVTADSMSPEAISLETFLELPPGTILKDSDVVAAKRMFRDLAEPVRLMAKWVAENPNDQQAFLSMLEHLPKVDEAVTRIAGAYAESGRTQRLLSQKLPTGGNVVSQTEERVRISDPYIQQWLAFFQQQDELAALGAGGVTKDRFVAMLASMKSDQDLVKFAKMATDPTWGDMLAEMYVQSALWGLAPVKNLLGNPIVFAGSIVDRGAAASVSALRASGRAMLGQGFQRDVYFGEVGAMLRGAVGSFGDAWRLAWQSFKEERALTQGATVEPMKKAITGDALALTGMPGAFMDFMGSALRMSGRSLLLGDEFSKGMAFNAELRALAMRKAHEVVNAQGATGAAADRLYKDTMEKILKNPDKFPSIKEAAQEFATYVTLTQELGPLGKSVQTWASSARTASGLPIGRFIMPFTTIATNAPRMAGEHSPLAVASKLVWDEIRAGGARRDLALAKIATGTAAMMVFADLASQGIVTGAGPRRKEARQVRHDATGWAPVSIWNGSEYISVAWAEPWSTLMGATADLTEMYAHAETVDQRGKIEAAMVAVNYALSRNITSKTYLMGMSGLLTAAMSGEIDSFQSFFNQLAAGMVPFAGAFRQVTAANDPVVREALDAVDAVKREIPGWSDTLRPARDFWGNEVIREGGFGWDFYNPIYVSKGRNDIVSKEFERNRFFPSMPSKQIDNIPLGQELGGEYDAYVRLSQALPIIGDMTLHQRLEDVVKSDLYKSSSDGPDGGKVVLLRDWITAYRTQAQHILDDKELSQLYLKQDFPDLREQFELKRKEKSQMFNAPAIR